MDIIIKHFSQLEKEELYEILKTRNKVFIVEQKCNYQDIDNKDKKSYHLYIKDNNKIAAYLRILPKGVSFEEFSLGRILVSKEYRKKGLARKIILKAFDFIKEEFNETTIRISGQAYLSEFYQSLGFKLVSDEYIEHGLLHIEMLKK